MTRPRPQVYWPRPIEVVANEDGVPQIVAGVEVDAVREEWLIEDRWWTPEPLRRRYFELVLSGGRNLVVFREAHGDGGNRSGEAERGIWFEQRA